MSPDRDQYIVSIEAEPFRKKIRYHWMVCWKSNPDEMVSWGHAPTQALAEAEAANEVRDLIAGVTPGGRAPNVHYTSIHHC